MASVSGVRISWMAGAIIMISACSLYFLLQDPLIADRLPKWSRSERSGQPRIDIDGIELRDPALGAVLPSGGVGAEVRALTKGSRRGFFLLYLGTCGECIRLDVKRWCVEAHERGIPVIGISESDDLHIQKLRKESKLTIPVVSDPANTVSSWLNAYWGGRAYYFSSSGELRWLMKHLESATPLDRIDELSRLTPIDRDTSHGPHTSRVHAH